MCGQELKMFKMSFLELPSGLGEGGRKVTANCGDLQFDSGGREGGTSLDSPGQALTIVKLYHSCFVTLVFFTIWGGVLNTPPLGGWYV